MSTVQDSWRRIEKWLSENAPLDVGFLASGATEQQIEEVEKVLGVRLPDDFRQSYLIHDGSPDLNPEGVFDYGEFFSLSQVVGDWSVWKGLYDKHEEFHFYESEPERGVKNSWWNRAWIPFCGDGSGNSLCVDLDPADRGTVGQVIEMVHDDSGRFIWAPSFAAWLSAYADSLEAGELAYDDGVGIVPIHLID